MLVKVVQINVDTNLGVNSDVSPTMPDIVNDETQDSTNNVCQSSSNLGRILKLALVLTGNYCSQELLLWICHTAPSYLCHCKIVSNSVDIRSAKVCELGLLNYKARRVFYPSETQKFRCRYHYYWASVFKTFFRCCMDGFRQIQSILGDLKKKMKKRKG
ncbi:hypothetical protein QVD17_09403 [Tagetes erecta]|uniref:Uncharacterized protein n=1 Tax=Tagetes erecta TaxID=13708 RepID=A0AAD8L498_TARER|nr:hypothetical protein QVD17_09403 [Tagetes erecta]